MASDQASASFLKGPPGAEGSFAATTARAHSSLYASAPQSENKNFISVFFLQWIENSI
jgi:hypothetical protein